jgi:hypothetical protein
MASASWVRGFARRLAGAATALRIHRGKLLTPSRWSKWSIALLAATMAGTLAAQVVDDPCKNHYILGVSGTPQLDAKCQSIAPPDPPPAPTGDVPSLRITQIYSTLDGSTQYVELTEFAGRNDQDHVAGLTLTSTTGGAAKTFVFPDDLPSHATANRSFIVAVVREPDGSSGTQLVGAGGCCYGTRVADFAMPARFLAIDGGTLVFAGVDRWTYPPLPTDGVRALYRDGTIGTAMVPRGSSFCTASGCAPAFVVAAPLIDAVEFRNTFDDRRYVTAAADAIDAIDSAGGPGWVRSGLTLAVGTSVTTRLGVEYTYIGSPVCRVRIATSDGIGYFYSVKQDECVAAAREPGAVIETAAAFYAWSPDWEAGTCAPMPGAFDGDIDLQPVYRVSSPLSAFDTRLTTDIEERDALVAAGWKKSGFGPDGTELCVP